MTAAQIKSALRAEMRRRRRAVGPVARADASRRLCERLLDEPLGGSVAVYLAGPDELDLTRFIEVARARGTRILAPRWTGVTYALAELRGLFPACLRVGPHGILEPREPFAGDRPAESLATAWLVPGLAFARDGRRLGYGGGWYDRLLSAAAPSARALGVAYPFQIVDDLPVEPHDIRLSGVVVQDVGREDQTFVE